MKVTAIGTNVVLKLNERPVETKGGIALLHKYTEAEAEGEVMSMGNKVEGVSVGDVAGFPKHLGTLFTNKGEEWLIIDYTKLVYVRA